MSRQIKYLVPVGMLGGGFTEEYFESAVNRGIDFIAIDSGSTDGGANNLGEDLPFFSRAAVKRDLRLMLRAARRLDIPLLVGSCGGSGGDWNLNYIWEIVQEIAAEEDLHFTTALIAAEVDRSVLVQKYRDGRVLPLHPAPEINEAVFTDTHRIVGMMGAEPFQDALRQGADVVLAGRASDAALMAAVPLMHGFDAGLSWHAAKIAECGGSAVTQMTKPEGIICTITDEYFELEPVSPEQSCTPLSVAAHALYETSNPFEMREPSGTMLLDQVSYEAASDRAVRVRGSRFEPAPHTVKLEGAALVGYRTAVLGGVTDPAILADFDTWFAAASAGAEANARRAVGDELADQCEVYYSFYGKNGVEAALEARTPDHMPEVGVLINVLAPTRELARSMVATVSHTILHAPVPQWHGLVSNLAFPKSPHEIDFGPAYSFVLNHAVEVDDPLELTTTTLKEV